MRLISPVSLIMSFALLMSFGCTSALQAPDVLYRYGSKEIALKDGLTGFYCTTVTGHECQPRYYDVAIDEGNLKNVTANYNFSREQRNRVQTLLLSYSDRMCANYHYRIYGFELGTRVGSNVVGDLASGLSSILPGKEIGNLLSGITNAFDRPGSILSNEFVQQSLFLAMIQGVSAKRREMKKYILAGYKYPSKYPDILNESKLPEVYNGKGSKFYTPEEAVSDALAYHRMCDLGAMLIGGKFTDEAHKDLFAYRFSREWQNGG